MQKLYAARGALHNRLSRSRTFVSLLTLFFSLFFAGNAFAQTVTTDKADYSPGEIAIISGDGWVNDQNVTVDIIENPVYDAGHHFNVSVQNGSWIIMFPIEDRHFGVTFTVYATGDQSDASASTSFTDGINQQPTNQTVCAHQNASFSVGLNGSQKDLASYTWYKVGDATPIGTVDDVSTTVTNGLYQLSRDANGGFLTIIGTPLAYNTNQYYVVVKQPKTATTSVTSNTVTLTVNSAPAIFNVDYDVASLCGGNFQITLSGSELGVSYTLYNQNNPSIETIIGTGGPIAFTAWATDPNDSKTYHVVATDNTKTCSTAEMNGTAKVTQASSPTAYNVTGGGAICVGTPGSYPIGISGSETTVSYQVFYDADGPGGNAPVAVGSATDGTGAAITNLYTASLAGTYTVLGTKISGNQCVTQMTGSAVIFVDLIPPTFDNAPGDVTVECDAVPPVPTVTASDNLDTDVEVTYNEKKTDGNCPGNYTLTRKWTAKDDCGNVATHTQTITVQDTKAPTASNPAPVDVKCIDAIPTPDITVVNDEADNCDNAPVVAWVKDEDNSGKGCPSDPYIVTRTYSVTDWCGNSITVTQTLTAIDDVSPTASDPAPVNVDCKTDIPAPDVTVVTDEADNCDNAPVVAWVKDENNGGSGCSASPYIVTRTYSVTDFCGNSTLVSQTLTAVDNTPPVVKTKDITVYLDENGQASISALDVNDGTFDACSGVNLGVNPYQFSCADIGTPVTVTLTATDDCGNTSTGTAIVTVVDNLNPVIVCKGGPIEFYLGDACQVTLTQDDVVESVSDNCGIASIDFVPPTFTTAGTYTVTVTAKDASGNSASCTTTVIIKKNPADIIYTGEVSKQYSDIANVSAIVYKAGTTTPLVGVKVKFALGSDMTQEVSAITDASGVASTTMRISVDPDPSEIFKDLATGGTAYTMTASVDETCYEGSTSTDFDVTQEDALITYTGQYFVTTATTKANSCNVILSATIRDISVLGTDLAPGDIRNAKVKFFIEETGQTFIANVGLVNMNDTLVGTASVAVNLATGPDDAASYTVHIMAGNYYTSDVEIITVTVSKPGGEHITGGGYIVLTPNVGGEYAGDIGSKNNFGFNVKYNKKNTNLQGHINTIIRRTVTKEDGMVWDDDCDGTDDYPTGHSMVRNFQVKGNAMTSLSVQRNTTPSPTDPATATYFGKANLADVTGDCPIPIMGNLGLRVDVTDKGEPGNMDSIAILVLNNKGGGVIYTSNWGGTSTAQQVLDGGNIVVGGNNYTSPTTTTVKSSVKVDLTTANELEVRVVNNPSAGASAFKLQLLSNDKTSPINLRVMDGNGKSVEARQKLQTGQTLELGRTYNKGMYFVEVMQGDQRKVIKLLKQ